MSDSRYAAGEHLGKGVILDILKLSGTTPCLMDAFMMEQIGAASSNAELRSLFESWSGPTALLVLSLTNML